MNKADPKNAPIGDCQNLNQFIETFPISLPTLLLTEEDPKNIDIGFWLDLFKKTKVEGVTFSAGGYVAYYPTKIPFHYRSKWLGDRDVFGELVNGARSIGLKYVIARTDPQAVHQEIHDARPEWLMATEDGKKRRHKSHPDVWMACTLGPYAWEFMNEVNKEIVSNYDVNFIFSNRWAEESLCFCDNCRRNFFDATGLKIPSHRDDCNPAWRKYQAWREERQFALASHWDREIRRIKAGARFIPNSGGGAGSFLDMVRLCKDVPFIIADRQARPPGMAPWVNGKNAKEYRACMGQKPVLAGVNLGVCGEHRWMDSVKSQPEYLIWLYEAVTNGMVPRFTKHSAVIYDSRWIDTTIQFFSWHKSVEKYFRNTEPLAQVAIVYSQQTGRHYSATRGGRRNADLPIYGWYQALVESRIPFEMVHDHLMDLEQLSKYKTLILPNIACLSEHQCNQLRKFVEQGGSLIVTGETSLYDEMGERRTNLGLSDLLGAKVTGPWSGPLRNTYMNIEGDAASGEHHPILNGLQKAGRIIGPVHRLPVNPADHSYRAPLTVVPLHPDLPMEEIYPREKKTGIPEVYLREFGKSRVVYFPSDLDQVFWQNLEVDHGLLLKNAINWATNVSQNLIVEGPGLLDVNYWRQKSSITVHLVNLTNPMAMRGIYREFFPVGPIKLKLKVPPSMGQVKGAKLLKSGSEVSLSTEQDYLVATIPEIVDYEGLALDF